MRTVTNSHLRKHGLSTAQYAAQGGSFRDPDEQSNRLAALAKEWAGVELGRKPDAAIALDRGCSREQVTRARHLLGIAAFQGILLTREGRTCRSMYEAMYDTYLHENGIAHRHEPWVLDRRYRADFALDDGELVEIVGMIEFDRYARRYERKRRDYETAGLVVRWLNRHQVEALYASCSTRIQIRPDCTCSRCGTLSADLVRGVCRGRCYMLLRRQTGTLRTCATCGCTFRRRYSDGEYCSRACYHRSHSFAWPSDDWLADQLRRVSMTDVFVNPVRSTLMLGNGPPPVSC